VDILVEVMVVPVLILFKLMVEHHTLFLQLLELQHLTEIITALVLLVDLLLQIYQHIIMVQVKSLLQRINDEI